MNVKKKVGPLPLWSWIAIAAGGLLVWYLWARSSSGSSTSTSGSTAANQVDPTSPLGLTYAQEQQDLAEGIDPNTGQSFASEQAAALAGSNPGAVDSGTVGGGGGVTDTGTAAAPGATLAGEIGDVGTALGALEQLQATPALQTVVTTHGPSTTSPVGSVTPTKGGAFYNYYKKVTGKAPPRTLSKNNWVFRAWQQRVPAGTAKTRVSGSGNLGHLNQHRNVRKVKKHTYKPKAARR